MPCWPRLMKNGRSNSLGPTTFLGQADKATHKRKVLLKPFVTRFRNPACALSGRASGRRIQTCFQHRQFRAMGRCPAYKSALRTRAS